MSGELVSATSHESTERIRPVLSLSWPILSLPRDRSRSAKAFALRTIYGSLELQPNGELRLSRRRVDVRQQRCGLAEQRTSLQVVAGVDADVRHVEVGAVEDVEQLRNQFGSDGA